LALLVGASWPYIHLYSLQARGYPWMLALQILLVLLLTQVFASSSLVRCVGRALRSRRDCVLLEHGQSHCGIGSLRAVSHEADEEAGQGHSLFTGGRRNPGGRIGENVVQMCTLSPGRSVILETCPLDPEADHPIRSNGIGRFDVLSIVYP
jgi:hypothetical protein